MSAKIFDMDINFTPYKDLVKWECPKLLEEDEKKLTYYKEYMDKKTTDHLIEKLGVPPIAKGEWANSIGNSITLNKKTMKTTDEEGNPLIISGNQTKYLVHMETNGFKTLSGNSVEVGDYVYNKDNTIFGVALSPVDINGFCTIQFDNKDTTTYIKPSIKLDYDPLNNGWNFNIPPNSKIEEVSLYIEPAAINTVIDRLSTVVNNTVVEDYTLGQLKSDLGILLDYLTKTKNENPPFVVNWQPLRHQYNNVKLHKNYYESNLYEECRIDWDWLNNYGWSQVPLKSILLECATTLIGEYETALLDGSSWIFIRLKQQSQPKCVSPPETIYVGDNLNFTL
jgi:hypothetical protein